MEIQFQHSLDHIVAINVDVKVVKQYHIYVVLVALIVME